MAQSFIDLAAPPYNIVGNGDDYTTQLLDAFDAASQSGHGATIIAPAGVIGFSQNIPRPRWVSLLGMGEYATEFRCLATLDTAFTFDGDGNQYDICDGRYYINGNGYLTNAISIGPKYDLVFRDILIEGCSGTGVISGAYYTRFEHILVAGGANGFQLYGGGSASGGSNGVVLDQCWAQLCTGAGVLITGDSAIQSSGIFLRNCLFDGNTTGIDIAAEGTYAPLHIVIDGCRFENNGANGTGYSVAVANQNVWAVRITNGLFSGTPQYHLTINADGVAIHGNTFDDGFTTAAIQLTSNANWAFVGQNTNLAALPLVESNGAASLMLAGDPQTGLTQMSRVSLNQGSATLASSIALSAGWGTTAWIASVTGDDARGRVTIASSGGSESASPTLTLTFQDGPFAAAPFARVSQNGGAQPSVPLSYETTAADLTITFLGTPADGESYTIEWEVMQ